MDVKTAIDERRAYRALLHDPITDEQVRRLAEAVRLAPSANDHQPWRLVFVRDPEVVARCKTAGVFPDFNEWVYRGAMFVAVCGRPGDDDTVEVVHKSYTKKGEKTVTSERPLYLFDLGIASAFMMLRATEMGVVAHPIAGYEETVAKDVFGIPEDYDIVAMLIVGKKTYDQAAIDSLPDDLRPDELERPERMGLDEFAFGDRFGDPIPGA